VRRELADGYEVDDDPNRVDIDTVHRYLSEESYWASRGIVGVGWAGSWSRRLWSADRSRTCAGSSEPTTHMGSTRDTASADPPSGSWNVRRRNTRRRG
jgi:hypothetical protein